MGKEGDLWDDSALINAFDDAISKYKIMHGRGQHDNSKEGGKDIGSTEESLVKVIDESHDAKRPAQEDDSSNIASNTTTEMGETSNLLPTKKNPILDSFTQDSTQDLPYGQYMQDAPQEYPNTQGAEDYTRLLNQYYELEEQQQKILQQLQQFGNWNYQGSGSSVQWGTCPVSQEHLVNTSQESYPAAVSSSCPYVCQCLVAPCPFGGSCSGKNCDATSAVGHAGKLHSFENVDIIKTATEAAEKALSSLKERTSEEGEQRPEGQLEQSANGETELKDVFNAWYLAEQATAKKLRG